MGKIRMMLADDHPAFRAGFSKLLSDEADIDVIATPENGEQAVQLALKLKPDIIMMDISMPKMNGLEAVRQIKNNLPQVGILMISAFNNPAYILSALRYGASGYLLKNTSLPNIMKAVRLVKSGEAVFDMHATGDIFRRLAMSQAEKRLRIDELTSQEMQVLISAAKGLGNKQIAERLKIGQRTVQTHLVNIYRKLQVSSRTEAVLQGLKQGWVTMDDLPDHSEAED